MATFADIKNLEPTASFTSLDAFKMVERQLMATGISRAVIKSYLRYEWMKAFGSSHDWELLATKQGHYVDATIDAWIENWKFHQALVPTVTIPPSSAPKCFTCDDEGVVKYPQRGQLMWVPCPKCRSNVDYAKGSDQL